jgi:hypothetical protein
MRSWVNEYKYACTQKAGPTRNLESERLNCREVTLRRGALLNEDSIAEP